jgi:hypothetical protein
MNMGALVWILGGAVVMIMILGAYFLAFMQQSTYTGVVSSFQHDNYLIAQSYTLEFYGGSSAGWLGTLNVTPKPGMNCTVDTIGFFWAMNLTCMK